METSFAPALGCTHCRKSFLFNDARTINGSRMPVILPCGHAICVLCGGSFKDGLECRECGIVAKRRLDVHRSGFPPHLGIIGGMMVAPGPGAQKKVPLPGLHYIPAGAPVNSPKPKLKNAIFSRDRIECDDCKFDMAFVRCIKCAKNYCQKCMGLQHGQGERMTHRAISLSGRLAQPSAPVMGPTVPVGPPVVKPRIFCLSHPEHKLDFLCEECNVTICAYCNLLAGGGHNGHRATFMEGPKYKPKIDELLQEAKDVKSELEFTIKTLHGGSKLSADWEALDKQISELVAWQFAQVQLNGMRLRAELAAARETTGTHKKLIDGAVQSLERIKGLMACSTSYEPRESLWLTQSLEEACAAPCRVYTQATFGSVRLAMDKEVFLDALEIGTELDIPDSSGMAVFSRTETIPDGWTLKADADQDPTAEGVAAPEGPAPQNEAPKIEAAAVLLAALELPKDPTETPSRENSVHSSQDSIVGVEPSKGVRGFIAPGTSDFVNICHVTDPYDFYVIRVADMTYRDRLTKKIQYAFRKLATPESVNFGDIVLAKYDGDRRWYRAQVSSVDAPAPRVLFLDYGNSGVVAPELLRTLPHRLAIVPPLAIRCRLIQSNPSGGKEWSNAAIKWFIKIAEENRLWCSVRLVKEGFAHVDLGEPTGSTSETVPLSVADSTVFMHFGQNHVEPAVHDEQMDLPSNFVRRPKVTFPDPRRWHVNEHFAAQVAHVEEADCFYVHRQDPAAGAKVVNLNDELTKLCQPLFDTAGDGENLPVLVPKKGMACAALFSVDDVWYRALVTELLDERRVKVFYVDYGNSDVVSYDDIRHLPQRFAEVPPLAIECCLHGIKPANGADTYSLEATKMVDELTNGRVVQLTVRKVLDYPTRYEVLAINTAGVNVARQLTQMELAVRTGAPSILESEYSDSGSDEDTSVPIVLPSKTKANKGRSGSALSFLDEDFPHANGQYPLDDDKRCGQAAMEDIVHMPIRPETVTDPSLTEIVFVKCVSPDQMFISLKSAIYHFNDMKVSMELYYAKSSPSDRTWALGDRCAALRARDRSWHRGIVREIDNNAGVALVELRDIVSRERVPLLLLRPLEESFTRVREAIFTVCIGGVAPAGGSTWTCQAGEFAARWVGIHKPTHIIKRGEITDGRLPVELMALETVLSGPLEPAVERFISLNKELVANGLALPIRGVQEWPKWTSVDIIKEVEESKEVADWPFPNQDNDPPEEELWPGVPTDRPLQPGSWLPIKAVDMVAFEAIPTNVDYNGYIYLHSIHDESTLKSMTAQLQRRFNSAPPPPGEFVLRPGMPCVTRYVNDNLWYRAETVKELSDGRWEVIFVDYGSRDTLPLSEIFPTTFLSEIPVICRKVALANIRPISEDGRWSMDGLDVLHTTIVDRQCTVYMKCPIGTPDPTTVLLMRADGVQISTVMVEMGFARYAEVKPGMVPGLVPLRPKRKHRTRSSQSHAGSDLGSELDYELGAERGSTPEPVPELECRDEQPSPDIIECSDEEDVEKDNNSVVEVPMEQMSQEESFDRDLTSEDVDLKTFIELDDTAPDLNLVETNESVDSTLDSRSNTSDDEDAKKLADQEDNKEAMVLNTTNGILSDKDENGIIDNNNCEGNNKDVSGSDYKDAKKLADQEDNNEKMILDNTNGIHSDNDEEMVLETTNVILSDNDEDVIIDNGICEGNNAAVSGLDEDVAVVPKTETSTKDIPKAMPSPILWVDQMEAEAKTKEEADDGITLDYRQQTFPSDDSVVVVVQAVESLKTVRVIPQDPASLNRLEKVRKLKARIQEEAPLQPLLLERSFPMACAAQFSDGQWRRTMLGAKSGSALSVWDVDSSRWEKVSFDRVCKCRAEWTDLPTVMVIAKLRNIKLAPGITTKAGKTALTYALQGKTFTARVLSRTPELVLELYVEGTTTSAFEPLIASGILEAADMD